MSGRDVTARRINTRRAHCPRGGGVLQGAARASEGAGPGSAAAIRRRGERGKVQGRAYAVEERDKKIDTQSDGGDFLLFFWFVPDFLIFLKKKNP